MHGDQVVVDAARVRHRTVAGLRRRPVDAGEPQQPVALVAAAAAAGAAGVAAAEQAEEAGGRAAGGV